MKEIDKINVLIKNFNDLKPLSPENKKILDNKFRLEFNFNTNHLEGNTITYSETELLLIFDDVKGSHTLRELEEMKGSDVAFQFIEELATEDRPLTEQIVKHLNQLLLVRPFWKEAITNNGQPTQRLIKVGDYKEYPNSVRLANGEIFQYATPIDTPILMNELINWYRIEEEKKEIHPVALAALLHYKFVCIHPFDDGNGRVSRLLMNYVLFKNNMPPIIIKTSDKNNYLKALHKADIGDIESFTKYIADQLVWSLEICIKAAKGESIVEPGDLDKKIKMLKQKLNFGNDYVKIIKSKEAILELLLDEIEPLIKRISKKVSEFDIMFKSKKQYIYNNSKSLNSNLETGFTLLENILRNELTESISYKVFFSDFRHSNKKLSVTNTLIIQFHENVYDITCLNTKINLSKLYDEKLTENEIIEIVEEFGTRIYEDIEKIISLKE